MSPIRKSWQYHGLAEAAWHGMGIALFGKCDVTRLCQQDYSHREGAQNGDGCVDSDPQCLAYLTLSELSPHQAKEARKSGVLSTS